MTHDDFFIWLRQQYGRLTQAQVDAANELLAVVSADVLQRSLANINKWALGGNMKISDAGLAVIKKWEGCRLKAYRDFGGVWTIGWGHTSAAGGLKVSAGLSITQEQADQLLVEDLERMTYPVLKRLVKVPLTQGQFDALCSFTYNLGGGQVGDSTLLRLLNNRDYDGAAKQFKRWVYDDGVELPGLVSRRADETELFLS